MPYNDQDEHYCYRIYLNRDEKLTIVKIRRRDDDNYDCKRFYKNEDHTYMEFDSEDEAATFLNGKFKREHIDPEFVTANNIDFQKMKKED